MNMNASPEEKEADSPGSNNVFETIARIVRWVAVAMIVGGAFVSSDSLYPVLPTAYTTVLAGGAVVLAASLFFQIEGIKHSGR